MPSNQANNYMISRGCSVHKNQGKDEPRLNASCCKYNTTPWLSGADNIDTHNLIEVRFKNSRKDFFINADQTALSIGDIVAVEASPGHDIGIVTLTGRLVTMKLKQLNIDPVKAELKKFYRKARVADVEKWVQCVMQEDKTKT